MKKHIILIPIYNDWKSLNKLLIDINEVFKNKTNIETQILILNDNSTEFTKIDNKGLGSIKEINLLSVKNNLGSQKIITVGLNYLSEMNEDFYVTIIDGDGEDNPIEIEKMLNYAKKYNEHIITSNRKKREESLIIKILYKFHLLITYAFSLKWISFGNFSSFHSKNIKRILSDNSAWYAYSSSIIKNCKIIRVYAKRESRYYDKSKLGLIGLIQHSLRINVNFSKKIHFMSLVYFIIFFFISPYQILNTTFFFMLLFYNLLIIYIKKKHFIENFTTINDLIKNISSV